MSCVQPPRHPVRLGAAPLDRNLVDEEKAKETIVAYHTRRQKEELEQENRKFFIARRRLHRIMQQKLLHLQQKLIESTFEEDTSAEIDDITAQMKDIAHHSKLALHYRQLALQRNLDAISLRRQAFMWTCPNDGYAYPFTWKGVEYHRTYDGEMWVSLYWSWAGRWAGYYIDKKATQ
jgi:hypothetical protein